MLLKRAAGALGAFVSEIDLQQVAGLINKKIGFGQN